MELRDTLRSLADLVLDVEQHETLADLDEVEQIRQIESMRADIAKGNRIAQANEEFTREGVPAWGRAEPKPAKKRGRTT